MEESKILRRCFDFVEAEALRTRLDAAGILSVINGADGHIILSYIGSALGGVKLEVAPEDYDRAVKLLEEDELQAAAVGPWICERCDEQNEATFELCWNCQKPRDGDDQRGRLDETGEASAGPPRVESTRESGPDLQDRNPYRPILLGTDAPETPATDLTDSLLDDAVRRAFAAAIFGIVLLPPLLNLYSVGLLLFSDARMAYGLRKHRGRLLLTWAIDIVAIIFWPLVLWRQWFG